MPSSSPRTYFISPSWQILLRDLEIDMPQVLQRARLPAEVFGPEGASLSTPEYFRLWQAVADESGDPLFPLRVGQAITLEAFDPTIFAAVCSPDLNTALQRIAQYKRLTCPMRMTVVVGTRSTRVETVWPTDDTAAPGALVATELVFLTQLARLATRHRVEPLRVTSPVLPSPVSEYTEFFGIPIKRGPRCALTFGVADATRPFLTANENLFRMFEPDLQRRLHELDAAADMRERVRTCAMEILASGECSMDEVARRLGVSSRSLQRKLSAEGTSFQRELSQLREDLARHYLTRSHHSTPEVAFLLGYQDTNSFYRAFNGWTGQTPEQIRTQAAETP